MSSTLARLRLRTPPRIHIASIVKTSCARRTINTATDPAPLPPIKQWRAVFPLSLGAVRDRVSLANPDTADMVAQAFLQGKGAAAGTGKIVIEAFPGPGCLSRALMRLDSSVIKKLIILEEYPPYLEYLRPLEGIDPRVSVVPKSGFDWDTYQYLEENGYLDEVETVPWEGGVHPQLHFISHIPHTIKGEQLVAQLFRNIPARAWLFKYGRVPMSLILGEWIWERVTAPQGAQSRCKVGVIAQATADLQNAVSPSALLPYDDHFHPSTTKNHTEKKPESRRLGHPLAAANIVPYENQVIQRGLLDKWDYILRRLFVLKSTPLKKAISGLAPGADSLKKMLSDPRLPPEEQVDLSKPIKKLTVADWALVIRAFDNWPFAPQDLFIHDTFTKTDR